MNQIEKQQLNIKNLLQLVKENPELEILPMVDYEVCASDDFSSWLGGWEKAEIDFIHLPDEQTDKYLNSERIYFKSTDEESIKDDIFTYYEAGNPAWSDTYIEEKMEEEYAEIEWEKVIVVKISLPNRW